MQNYVFVVDTNKKPVNPVTPRRARKLLEKGKAAVWRNYPFTIILKHAVTETVLKPLTVKIDPGSRFTGIAVSEGENVIWGAEVEHRGYQIKQTLESRRSLRRSRRNRKTRYRKARFDNRKRSPGWIPPSLMHRVLTTQTWVKRLIIFAPVAEIWIEKVKFDMHKMQNPEISGVEYQQGDLQGYEVREYLLEKWGRECSYCRKKDVPLQIEHIHPRSKGGSNRVSNLCLACEKCNQKKGNKPVEDFLRKKPELLKKIKSNANKPLKDASAVNSTRNKVVEVLFGLLPVKTATGAQTKYNRIRLKLEKQHWIDAACVGDVEKLVLKTNQPLRIKCNGHGTRQMCGTNKFGFPTRHRGRKQIHFGFTTGDIVKAVVTKGKKIGTYFGRLLCRKSGSFDIATKAGRVAGISYKFCTPIHKKDGYSYSF
ncbi:RNA-guided endonuclease IscB [Mastigocoleus testarum]|uniref:HNH endonuclease n=1 Tax=Mastigocoleus testarum BC008 TaxID=371196 RepID=A0A0V7ZQ13_9CYAN|nr:RNA-guided endonuclease IscB [Mastigocoleus testarum]KST66344.1 HNH endonuclease [Mastigocoleus testarum BC008]KST66665.1 HNH endonuclease [Mastigocoleus testarum BC008]